MRILLVEDDKLIGDGIRVGLRKHGFTVDWLTDGRVALHALEGSPTSTGGITATSGTALPGTTEAPHDAVVLDLTLPGMDGLDLLRQWRKQGHDTPVLVLTARSALDQRIEGLNLGADDYLPKPFALEELAARLHALLRRSHGQSVSCLAHGEVTFNPHTRQTRQAGQDINLSPKAVALLEIFLLNKKRILSKALLEEKLYPWGEEISSNAVEVHVHHLRAKLGSGFIKTVHGQGYLLGDDT